MEEIDNISCFFTAELPKNVAVALNQLTPELNDTLLFKLDGCIATVGYGTTTERSKSKPWATVYSISGSSDDTKTRLLAVIKDIHDNHGYDFGFSFADTTRLKQILYKLRIKEREQGSRGVFRLN